MSSCDFSRVATFGDSNIPVPKKTLAATRRTKGCTQLPELQKYIETIIKASNESESEGPPLPERGKGFRKQRTAGRYSVFKGNDNSAKHEKVKLETQVTASKSKNKAKTPYPEAVSSDDEIPNVFVRTDFEDPRNWKTDDQNRGPKSEFENFLKQFFPNPYHLGNVTAGQDLNSDITPEMKQEDELGDETVAHVPISDVCTQTEVESEITNDALVIADSEIRPCKRGSDVSCKIEETPSLKYSNRPESRLGGRRGSFANFKRVPTPSKIALVNRSSHSTVNVSSKNSSLESVSVGSQNRTTTPKESYRKSRASSRQSSRKEMKLTSSTEDFSEEAFSDYDLKKLKLLSMTDSDDSSSKNMERSKDMCEDFLSRTPSTAFDGLYESGDSSDLRQIFDVMNKATESFLEISLKTDQNSAFDYPQDAEGNEKMSESITQLSERKAATRQSAQDYSKAQQDEWERKESENCCMEQERGSPDLAKSEEVEKSKAGVGSLVNLLLREEKPESTNCETEKPSDALEAGLSREEEQEDSSRHEEVTDTCFILGDLEQVDSVEEEQDAGQKIDEVLQFMYDCLKKFSNQEKELFEGEEASLLEDKKEIIKPKASLTNVAHERTKPSLLPRRCNTADAENPSEGLVVESYPRVKEIQSESSTMMDETKRKPVVRSRCRKRQDRNSPLAVGVPPPGSRLPQTIRRPETHPTADTTATSPTVEGQNELGSYSERPPLSALGANDSHTGRSILPHSVKLKKGKTDTQKTLKDVLDTEEKLLANYLSCKPPEKKAPEKPGDSKIRKTGNHVVVRSGKATTYSLLNDFKRSNSNFVICVSSLPRNLRTMAANRTSLTLSPSFSLSLNNAGKAWDIRPLPYFQKLCLKKIPVILDIPRSALKLSYIISEGGLLTAAKGRVAHVARPLCLGRTLSYSKSEQEFSLKNSECLISIKIKPIKKSLFVESSAIGCIIKPFGVSESTTTDNSSSAQTEGNPRVDCLLEALEKTEGRLRLLEQNEFIATESVSSCSANEAGKYDSSEIDWEGENGHEKVHNLLLRTYSLQQKLHQYLYKMTCFQHAPLICPLTRQDYCSHLGVVVTDQTDMKILPEKKASKAVVASKPVTEKTTTVEVQTSDHALSYSPSSERNKQTGENMSEPEAPKDAEEERDTKREEDDNSSICSFKSSNDFSESNDITNLESKPKPPEKIKSNDFLKKIISEIDSFRQTFKTVEEDHLCVSVKGKSSQNLKENRLTEYDAKMPAKVLKTVFKGQKSMTELTIGLKDVPMTQVRNISVEKRKFSPNHTKISICILKEKPKAAEKANTPNSVFKTNSSVPRNKFSNLYFDQIRPSISRCRTEYSRLEDDLSKTSESVIESSEDDDDDFKSVASSLSIPDVRATNEQETKDETQTASPPPPPKTFTKYRFDFYRKMDMSLEANQPKPKPLSPSTVCRYKDFEPLKQALTEMQIRMRSIQQDTVYSSNDYYERALRLAKMSAGYCQNCGNRAVIPKDTFGYYRTLLPRRHSSHRHSHPFKMAVTSNPSYYSFRSTNREVGDGFCDLDIKHSSSYLPNHKARLGRAIARNSPPVLRI